MTATKQIPCVLTENLGKKGKPKIYYKEIYDYNADSSSCCCGAEVYIEGVPVISLLPNSDMGYDYTINEVFEKLLNIIGYKIEWGVEYRREGIKLEEEEA